MSYIYNYIYIHVQYPHSWLKPHVSLPFLQLKEMLQHDQRLAGMREGEGATAMELFDEYLEELRLKGPEAYHGVEPAPAPPVQALLSALRERGSKWPLVSE